MSTPPPIDKTLTGVLKQMAARLTLLERRTTKAASWGPISGRPPQIDSNALLLGSTDLNTVMASGWYVQTSNSNATTARNYPAPAGRAGELEVTGNIAGTDFVMQRYTDYQNNETWRRTHYNGTWYGWRLERDEVPVRLSADGKTVTDWNDAIEVGFYRANGAANAPPGWAAGVAVFVREGPSRVIQEAVSETTSPDTQIITYRRTLSGSTWTAWLPVGTFNGGTLSASTPPSGYALGVTFGDADSSFPTSLAVVEVVKKVDIRTVQRVSEKSGWQRTWHRTAVDSATWSPWVLDGGDSDWKNLTVQNAWAFASPAGAYRIRGDTCYLRGEFFGGANQTAVFTLPTEARPASRTAAMVARYATTSVPPFGTLAINTTGECTFNLLGGTIPTASPGFTLLGFSYLLD